MADSVPCIRQLQKEPIRDPFGVGDHFEGRTVEPRDKALLWLEIILKAVL